MRDILFKAKRLDNNEWIVGGILHQTDYYGMEVDKWYIIDGTDTEDEIGYHYEVDHKTICQYTGLTDANNAKIWQGDIVYYIEDDCYWVIQWSEHNASLSLYTALENGGYLEEDLYDFVENLEVIGNVFDNPELLKKVRKPNEDNQNFA